MFRYALYILHTISDVAMATLFHLVRAQPSCSLTKCSGHLSPFSQDGLEHSEVILSCRQLIPNSQCLCLKRAKQLHGCLVLKRKKKKNEQLVSFLSYRPPQWSSSQSEKSKQIKTKQTSTGVYFFWIPERILFNCGSVLTNKCYR